MRKTRQIVASVSVSIFVFADIPVFSSNRWWIQSLYRTSERSKIEVNQNQNGVKSKRIIRNNGILQEIDTGLDHLEEIGIESFNSRQSKDRNERKIRRTTNKGF